MKSFQITIDPRTRAAGRFIGSVRRGLQKAYAEAKKNSGIKQTDIARALGVHRSVVNRELTGLKDMTLGRVAELAFLMGKKAEINFHDIALPETVQRAAPPITDHRVGDSIYHCDCHARMGNDFYFLPMGSCLRKDKPCSAPGGQGLDQ